VGLDRLYRTQTIGGFGGRFRLVPRMVLTSRRGSDIRPLRSTSRSRLGQKARLTRFWRESRGR
jgi:hypothetical protein